MRVLMMTPLFRPEFGAGVHRMLSIARGLTSKGHEVVVATGMPNYPTGKVYPEYRGRVFIREEMEDFTVLRSTYYIVPRNRSKVGQMLSYLTFLPALVLCGLRAGKADVVFVTSPPHFNILSGIFMARLRREAGLRPPRSLAR